MTLPSFDDLEVLRCLCSDVPAGDAAAATAVEARQARLTKPAGSLGRLEEVVSWLARWQGRAEPRLDRVEVVVFAGNHGVVRQGVSPFPPTVTAQMVANYAAGGAAINQIAGAVGASLHVVPLRLDTPTADITEAPALDEAGFLDAVRTGWAAVTVGTDLLCLGEMGIGNTTAAAALAAALFGGGGARWAGRGTGLDDAGLLRKQAVVDQAVARHAALRDDPLGLAAALGGREMAAILGAVLAARHKGVPVLLDGFVCAAAVAPLHRLNKGADDGRDTASDPRHAIGPRPILAHVLAAHRSAEHGGGELLRELGLAPLMDLGLRLGEASGAALAVPLIRAALACHAGMASFEEAGVTDREA